DQPRPPALAPLSLHDALPICRFRRRLRPEARGRANPPLARVGGEVSGSRVARTSGARRAAALLLCVEDHAAAQVLAHLTEHEIEDRKSTRLNSSHQIISYAVF